MLIKVITFLQKLNYCFTFRIRSKIIFRILYQQATFFYNNHLSFWILFEIVENNYLFFYIQVNLT